MNKVLSFYDRLKKRDKPEPFVITRIMTGNAEFSIYPIGYDIRKH